MKETKRTVQEHAVSPVVGVMLMLVVTIIIAAVVSAFAGGMGSGTQKAPQASIDVKIDSAADNTMGGTNVLMTFTELSGDPIQTKDLAIVTYYKNKTGFVYKNKQVASSPASILFPAGSSGSHSWDATQGRVPYKSDMRTGSVGTPQVDFGNYTWKTGDILSSGSTAGTADLLAINDDAALHGIRDPGFGPGSVVDVKILHVPSGQYIFNKEVIVQ